MKKSKTKEAAEKPPLVILGTASSRSQAPFDDDSIEIWGVGTTGAYDDVKRVDRLFETHPRRYWGDYRVMDRLNSFDGPIYMKDHYDEIPNSVKYPYEEVREMFYLNVMKDNLFVTNSITWMILLALYEGYRDISIFGVHMAHDTEYGYQQSSCSWVLGIIHGYILQGLPYSLYIAEESELLTARYEYGFFEPTREMQWVAKRRDGLLAGIKEADKRIEDLKIRRWKTEGAASEADIIYKRLAGYK